jgi:hypothetical protein
MFLSRKGNRHVSLARMWRNSQIVTNFTASSLTFWRCHVSLYHYSADRNAHETSFRGSYFITPFCVTNSVTQGWRTNGTWHSLLSQIFCFISFARPVSVYVYIYTYLTPYRLCIHYHCCQKNTANETFVHKPGAVRSVDWMFMIGCRPGCDWANT